MEDYPAQVVAQVMAALVDGNPHSVTHSRGRRFAGDADDGEHWYVDNQEVVTT